MNAPNRQASLLKIYLIPISLFGVLDIASASQSAITILSSDAMCYDNLLEIRLFDLFGPILREAFYNNSKGKALAR